MSKLHDYLKKYKDFFYDYGYSFNKSYFCRLKNDIAFCFEFSYNSLIYCNYYFVPLYIPSLYRYFTYGNRIEKLTNFSVKPLNPNNSFDSWMSDIINVAVNEIIPFFETVSSAEKLVSLINFTDSPFDQFIACSSYEKMILHLYTSLYLGNIDDARVDCFELEKILLRSRNRTWAESEIKKIVNIKSNILQLNKNEISELMYKTIANTARLCGFKS